MVMPFDAIVSSLASYQLATTVARIRGGARRAVPPSYHCYCLIIGLMTATAYWWRLVAPDFESGGQGFESLPACHFPSFSSLPFFAGDTPATTLGDSEMFT